MYIVYIFFICKNHTRPSPTTLTLKADMLPSLHDSLVLLHSFICYYSYNFNFDICRYKTFKKKPCQNDGYCMEMPKMVRTEKTAFKSKYMCDCGVCVHYVVQEFVHPKFFALVLTAASFVS